MKGHGCCRRTMTDTANAIAGIVFTKTPTTASAGNRSRRTKEMMPTPTPHTAETAMAMTIAPKISRPPLPCFAMTTANAMPPIGQSSEAKPKTGDALTRSGALDAKRSSVAVPRLRDRAEVILFVSRCAPSVSLNPEHFWPWQCRHHGVVAGWCSRVAHRASVHDFISSVSVLPFLRIATHVAAS